MFATDQDAANALEKGNGAIIEVEEISFPERPIRLMYAEAPTERPEGNDHRTRPEASHEEVSNEEVSHEEDSSEDRD